MDGCCPRIHQDRRIGHEMHCRTRMQRDTISMLIGMRFLAGRRRRSQEATFDLERVIGDIDPRSVKQREKRLIDGKGLIHGGDERKR